tara:strand:+ start:8667 stop:9740 length:1074 start_codon:yes stop_codon:yes gene_type:complete
MTISTELLNTTFADLRGPLVNSFVRSNELFEALNSKARMPMEGGTKIERSFSGGAPARGVGVYVGDELLNMTRRQQIRKFEVEPHRMVMAINIPKKELNQNSGKLAVIRLIEEYPQSAMDAAKADLNKFLLTGTSRGLAFNTSELLGMQTLNGNHSTGIGTGVTNGLLDFQTFATQTDVVQNVAKSASYFHANQFEQIGGGMEVGVSHLRRLYRKCAHYAGGVGKGPDMVIMDDDTYTNYESFTRGDNIRVNVYQDKTDKTNTLALSIGLAEIHSSIDLDRTDTTAFGTTGPADGVTYMLNTDYFEFAMLEAPNISEFKERVGDQDVVTAIFAMQGNMICTKLAAQGCAAGGGRTTE